MESTLSKRFMTNSLYNVLSYGSEYFLKPPCAHVVLRYSENDVNTTSVCRDIASDRRELARLGITHILNCAQSKWRGGAEYYAGMNITYHGIEAHDSPTFDMSVNFYPAAEFIHKALTSGGKSLNVDQPL